MQEKPTSVNSLSGGKTSSFMAVHYPADVNIFACVCIDYPAATPKDPAILKYCSDKLNGDFIASAEHDKTLKVMMQLEQLLGKEIVWVRGKSFDTIKELAGLKTLIKSGEWPAIQEEVKENLKKRHKSKRGEKSVSEILNVESRTFEFEVKKLGLQRFFDSLINEGKVLEL